MRAQEVLLASPVVKPMRVKAGVPQEVMHELRGVTPRPQLLELPLALVLHLEFGRTGPEAILGPPRLPILVPEYVLRQAGRAPQLQVNGIADLPGEPVEEGRLALLVFWLAGVSRTGGVVV